MNASIEAETLVEAARRQGLRVGAVSFPTVDGRDDRRSADFGLVWSSPLTSARIVELTRADFKREWVPTGWTPQPSRRPSFSPVMRARLEWSVPDRFRGDVDVFAYDSTNDGRENYDTYVIETNEREIERDARGWFALSAESDEGVYGSWSKVLRAGPSLDVEIYWGSVGITKGYPESFRRVVEEEAGFWPGAPDERSPIDADTFIEQADRLGAFYTATQLVAIRQMDFDLLLAYQPQIDEASHAWTGRPDGDRVIDAAFASADRAVRAIADALTSEDAFIVTGDHGLVPTRQELRLRTLLRDGGFAPAWQAFASGSRADLYGPAESAEAVAGFLRATGLFERVERKTATSHPRSGDVMAWAHADMAIVGGTASPAVVAAADGGHHGGLNVHRALHTVLFATGAGIRPGSAGEIPQTRIARFVSELLGIAPPQDAD